MRQQKKDKGAGCRLKVPPKKSKKKHCFLKKLSCKRSTFFVKRFVNNRIFDKKLTSNNVHWDCEAHLKILSIHKCINAIKTSIFIINIIFFHKDTLKSFEISFKILILTFKILKIPYKQFYIYCDIYYDFCNCSWHNRLNKYAINALFLQ